MNPGTRDQPLQTLTAAVAKGSTIYACNGASGFSEAVVVDKAVTLFGALDCTIWAYDATNKTQLTAASDAVPLTLSISAGGSGVEDVEITAADALKDGGSSIAVIVADGVMASFIRTDITAGNGKDGLAGTTPTMSVGPTSPTDPMIAGTDGGNACTATSQQLGGAAVTNPLCASIGGAGGVGAVSNGSNGDVNPATPQTALGGAGQPNMDPTNMWSCLAGSGLGTGGTTGGNGKPGTGAKSSDLGALDAQSGYTGVAGTPGGVGQPGQGGGGGGGAKGKTTCAGASGGSGGAGGCAGNGGTGGTAGGASIGIVSLGGTLVLATVTISLGTAGKGGDGAVGQGGGVGGKGGSGGIGDATAPATASACDGGNGGPGGQGGTGGGGRGGHAIGIAYTGTVAPSMAGVSFLSEGTAGMGGAGDDSMGNLGDGAPGVAVDTQGF
jgi:hypothetical protein